MSYHKKITQVTSCMLATVLLATSIIPAYAASTQTSQPIVASKSLVQPKSNETTSDKVEVTGYKTEALPLTTTNNEFTYEYGVNINLPSDALGGTTTYQYEGNDITSFTPDKPGDYRIETFTVLGDDPNDVSVSSVKLTITKRKLTVKDIEVNDKEYDGTITSTYKTGPTLSGLVEADDSFLYSYENPTFTTKNVGNNIAVKHGTFSLDSKFDDYYTINTLKDAKANITKKELTVSNLEISDKTYDKTNVATWKKAPTLNGIVSGDTVTLKTPIPTFKTKDAGNNIEIMLDSDFSISGTDSENYNLNVSANKTSSGITANITKAILSITANDATKEYGQLNPDLSYTISGFMDGDNESMSGYRQPDVTCDLGRFTSLGEHKNTIIVSNAVAPDNYEIKYTNATMNVTASAAKKDINYSINTANGKNGFFVGSETFTIKPLKSETSNYDKISMSKDGPWLDQIAYDEDTDKGVATFYLKDSENGAISMVGSESYKVDKTKPEIDNIEFNVKNSDQFHRVLNLVTFKHFFNQSIDVTITASDKTSGVNEITYTLDNEGKETTKTAKGDETTFTLSPNFKGTISATATDNAGNNSNKVKSSGVVIENGEQRVRAGSAVIDLLSSEKDYYNSDVLFKLSAKNTYSGLNNVKYELGSDSGSEEVSKKGSKMVQTWSKNATLKATNNKNHTKVKISYEDNSGNTSVSSKYYNLDISKPEITVSYDNNKSDGVYYNKNRTATITINERNFSNKDTIITLSKNDKKYRYKSNFSTDGVLKTRDDGSEYYTYVMNIPFNTDGDYTFKISSTDKAGNKNEAVKYEGENTNKFTIDKTKPVMKISFDNNSVQNKKYYKKKRVGTIRINEHNFDSSRVKIETNGSKGSWSNNGDIHTLKVSFHKNGTYHLNVSLSDKAGNKGTSYKADEFVIDLTAPKVIIKSPKDQSSNAGDIQPEISISDTNYNKSSSMIQGYNNGKNKISKTDEKTKNGVRYVYSSILKMKGNDDYYTLSATATDKAGNTTKKTIHFTVNRYGSVYVLEQKTKALNGNYVKSINHDIIIYEYNPDKLVSSIDTITRNGKTITCKKQTTEEVKGWHKYTYTMAADNFNKEGSYKVALTSTDKAGNKVSSDSKAKNTELKFGIDKTKPNVLITNITNNKVYAEKNKTVKITVEDNLVLDNIAIYKNGKEYQRYSEAKDEYDIPFFDLKSKQNIKVIAYDKAGNETIIEKDFYVTTDLWIRYTHNIPLIVLSIFVPILLIGIIIFAIVKKRKDEENHDDELEEEIIEEKN